MTSLGAVPFFRLRIPLDLVMSPHLSLPGRESSWHSLATLYRQAAARERPYNVDALRALADDLESYRSFQTVSVLRHVVAEAESEQTPGAGLAGR